MKWILCWFLGTSLCFRDQAVMNREYVELPIPVTWTPVLMQKNSLTRIGCFTVCSSTSRCIAIYMQQSGKDNYTCKFLGDVIVTVDRGNALQNRVTYLSHAGSKHFIEVTIPLSWDAARIFCENLFGDSFLAEIKTVEEFLSIKENIVRSTIKYLWIGGRDVGNNDQFVWVSSETVTYMSDLYLPGEPRYVFGDCLMLLNGGTWVENCALNRHFICEVDMWLEGLKLCVNVHSVWVLSYRGMCSVLCFLFFISLFLDIGYF